MFTRPNPRRRPSKRPLAGEFLESRRVMAVLADLDSDGDLDGFGQRRWFENVAGQTNFVSHLVPNSSASFVAAADLDGDGDQDLVSLEPRWYENTDGQGTFGASHPIQIPAEAGALHTLHTSYRTVNGQAQLVGFTDTHTFLLAKPTNSSALEVQQLIAQPAKDADDFEGDGDLDLVQYRINDPSAPLIVDVVARRNRGDNTFETQTIQSSQLEFSPSTTRLLQDIDGDQRLDVLTESVQVPPPITTIHWFRNTGAQFAFGGNLEGVDGFGVPALVLRDFTEDGTVDFLCLNEPFGISVLTLGIADDNPSTPHLTRVISQPNAFSFIDAADLNGDSVPDLVKAANTTFEWVDGIDYLFGNPGSAPELAINALHAALRGDRPLSPTLDINQDGVVNATDATHLIKNIIRSTPGDANFDKIFNSTDLVKVFQTGEYEDNIARNSRWREGDWNGDGDFDTGDLVYAFQNSVYEPTAIPLTGTNGGIGAIQGSYRVTQPDIVDTPDLNANWLIDGDLNTSVNHFTTDVVQFATYRLDLTRPFDIHALRLWYERKPGATNGLKLLVDFFRADNTRIGTFHNLLDSAPPNGQTAPHLISIPVASNVSYAVVQIMGGLGNQEIERLSEIEFVGLEAT